MYFWLPPDFGGGGAPLATPLRLPFPLSEHLSFAEIGGRHGGRGRCRPRGWRLGGNVHPPGVPIHHPWLELETGMRILGTRKHSTRRRFLAPETTARGADLESYFCHLEN